MTAKIKITERLESDLFGQYKGIYLSSESRLVEGHSEVIDKIPRCNLSKMDVVYVNSSAIKSNFEVGSILECNCIPYIYALNPEKGIILTITRIL